MLSTSYRASSRDRNLLCFYSLWRFVFLFLWQILLHGLQISIYSHVLLFTPLDPQALSNSPPFQTTPSSHSLLSSYTERTYQIINHSNHQAATRTNRHILTIPQVGNRNLESISTGTRVVIYLSIRVIGHVLDFNLVVHIFCHFAWWRGTLTSLALQMGEVLGKECWDFLRAERLGIWLCCRRCRMIMDGHRFMREEEEVRGEINPSQMRVLGRMRIETASVAWRACSAVFVYRSIC